VVKEKGDSRPQKKGKTLKDHDENKGETGTNALSYFPLQLKKSVNDGKLSFNKHAIRRIFGSRDLIALLLVPICKH